MDHAMNKWRENPVARTWERCRSLGCASKKSVGRVMSKMMLKSKSWHCTTTPPSPKEPQDRRKKKPQVAPDGCFSVYVGPQRKRFVVKTEFANHPLFRMLLEDAEMEYGYNSEGPILLPCDVDLFCKVLAEMDSGLEISTLRGLAMGCSPLILCSPARGRTSASNEGYGSYKLLSPQRMLKLNRF